VARPAFQAPNLIGASEDPEYFPEIFIPKHQRSSAAVLPLF
jgi:hypothetical protein